MFDLSSLNPQQRLAVETTEGPVLILAGARTGKTRVITCRIAHMIREKGIRPGNILAVTFTNKAAREMKERVAQLVGRNAGESSRDRVTISTFHSLGARILRQHIDKLGYKKNFVIYDEQEQLGAIKKILSHISVKGETIDPNMVLNFLSRYKNGAIKPAAFTDDASAALAQRIQSRYESALHACNAIDFDDLLLLTLRLFRDFSEVLENCRRQYRYVMVDEYQDTNAAEFRGANRRSSFAPISSRGLSKWPCAMPRSATAWSAARVISTAAKCATSLPILKSSSIRTTT